MGSGSWQRFGTKATVEDSLGMSMRDFRGRIFLDSSGTLTWSGAGDSRSTVGFSVTWGDAPIITLKYRWGGEVVVRIPVHLQATPTGVGGGSPAR